MAKETREVKHTDIYGTWTVASVKSAGDPGFRAGSTFRITHDLTKNPVEHVLEKIDGLKWNTTNGPIVLKPQTGPNRKALFAADIEVVTGGHKDAATLLLDSKNGAALTIEIRERVAGTGHTGSGKAGRP